MNIEIRIQNQLKISGTSAHTTTNEITSASARMYKDLGIDHVHQLPNLLSLQSVQTVAMDGQPHIDKIALLVERIVKTVVMLTISPKSVKNLNSHTNRNPE